ncbi:MAG: 23S rRNA (adenine(2503)-C(2))-methyltransferase RlmN [Marinilabiliaceae bacterium]|nr:23S rRNA (adenine(2503)-C(2))-methyltransferase RlmN [Marinilabiliaceae bacterium]
MKECLLGKSLNEITNLVIGEKLPKFTGKQIADWIYKKNVESIDQMTNLSKSTRLILSKKYKVGREKFHKVQESTDGTKKYLFPTLSNQFIESAYIPEENRNTLCISSQVGCKMGCLFCMTGKQGFQENLTATEIINQVVSLPEYDTLSNIVYMGMGEPMDNIDEVLKSLEIFTSEWGLAWSPRRITVSTIGIIPAMKRFIEESEAHLAISLHTPFNDDRIKLMPIEKVHPIENVISEIRKYNFGRQRRISFEYIMLKGINDTPRHIKGLSKLLNGLRCRINLIRFHPIPDTPLLGSDQNTIEWFKNELNNKGITTTIRQSRGEDIFAACGLLSTKELTKKQNNNTDI